MVSAADRHADGGSVGGNRSAAVAVEELMLRPQKTEQESR
jgi:hypothetical protein